MDKKEILEFISRNTTAFVATAEGDIPHVRALGTFRADEKGIIFAVQSYKDVYRQILDNPNTELCYWAEGLQIRVVGKFEAVKDLALKKQIVEKRPFYKPGVEKEGWDYVGAFIVKNARATILDMKGPPSPASATKTWIDL
jgi:pyridoxamine 5'-phosphate oxidase